MATGGSGKKSRASGGKAWVVSVAMGLGHQRAVYPLRDIAQGGLITMQDERYTCRAERPIWVRTRILYESVSRAGRIPLIGHFLIKLLEWIGGIPPFYPRRDLSRPTAAVRFLDRQISRRHMGKRLVEIMEKHPLPLVTSFYAVAIAAEKHGYSGPIYSIICDTDFNRAWLPVDPRRSRILYFSPCSKVTERLTMCGVPLQNILTTGFPLPRENIGSNRRMALLRQDVAERLVRLDPENRFRRLHESSTTHYLGRRLAASPTRHSFTITFAVGGAGAQVDIGTRILRSLEEHLRKKEVMLNLVAGIRPEVAERFERELRAAGLESMLNKSIRIIFSDSMARYMQRFNQALRTTDILWTKPSELTFYGGLGLPIIAAPPIGAHEKFNYRWLLNEAGVIRQEDPRYTDQWLFDYWRKGLLAERAWLGFLRLRKLGTYNIQDVIRSGRFEPSHDVFER